MASGSYKSQIKIKEMKIKNGRKSMIRHLSKCLATGIIDSFNAHEDWYSKRVLREHYDLAKSLIQYLSEEEKEG